MPCPVRDGGDDQIDRRQPVVPGARELALGVDGSFLDLLVDLQQRQRSEFVDQVAMLSTATR